jgi:hypothetical protein
VEVAYTHHRDSWEQVAQETTSPLSVSGQLFAFPWTRVSPYATAGYTWTTLTDGARSGQVKGPHAGLGLELALGESAALGLEGRYTHYGDFDQLPRNTTSAGALQGTLGLNFYF